MANLILTPQEELPADKCYEIWENISEERKAMNFFGGVAKLLDDEIPNIHKSDYLLFNKIAESLKEF